MCFCFDYTGETVICPVLIGWKNTILLKLIGDQSQVLLIDGAQTVFCCVTRDVLERGLETL